MAHIRFATEFYNTTGPSAFWRVEIIDTESGGGITLPLRSNRDPIEEFEGLPQDLKPGIYPTSFRIGLYMEHGTHEGLIIDLLNSNEKRFVLKAYKDYTLQFCGFVVADQCNYEDQYYPFLLNVFALDGLYVLGSTDYVSAVGRYQYHTVSATAYDVQEYVTTPLTDTETGAGSGYVMFEHFSRWSEYTQSEEDGIAETRTTYARLFQYASSSPGTGWLDQGGGLWTFEPTYTNEVIDDTGDYYQLTRDIDNDPRRTIIEYLTSGFQAIGISGEYSAQMWDTASAWYEANMDNFDDDPFSMIRLHEEAFLGKKWNEVFNELAKLFYLRIYYSQGRYHVEQISRRTEENFTRWAYNSAGTLLSIETTALDINLSTANILSGPTGQFDFLAALSAVEITFDLRNSNLLDGLSWETKFPGEVQYNGQRYLGRIKKEVSGHKFQIQLNTDFVSYFNAAQLDTLPDVLKLAWSQHTGVLVVVLRIHNNTLGTLHYRDEDGGWSTSHETLEFPVQFVIQQGTPQFSILTETLNLDLSTEEIPGNVGDVYEIYITVFHLLQWDIQQGYLFWNVDNEGTFTHTAKTHSNGTFLSVDEDGNQLNANQNRIYHQNNTVQNSLKVESTVLFADVGKKEYGIEILGGDGWIKSNSEWSVNGDGDGVEILDLLAQEIMSLRVTPKRIYATEFLSCVPSADNRLLKANYYYLPLRVSRNPDMDAFSGEFLQIDQTEPPGGGIISNPHPDIGVNPPFTTGEPSGEPSVPYIALETEGAITAGTYTQCDILNTADVFVASGAVCRIQHPTNTGTWVNVTLTQPIFHDSTVMYFVERIFLDNYPDASPIIVEADLNPVIPTSTNSYFDAFLEVFSGNEFAAPSYTNFPDTEGQGAMAINARIQVWRQGLRIFYRPGSASEPDPSVNFYDLDSDTKTFLFPVPFENESLKIYAY